MTTLNIKNFKFDAKVNERSGNVIVTRSETSESNEWVHPHMVTNIVIDAAKRFGFRVVRRGSKGNKFTIYSATIEDFESVIAEATPRVNEYVDENTNAWKKNEEETNSPGLYEVYRYSDAEKGWGYYGAVAFVNAINKDNALRVAGVSSYGYGSYKVTDRETIIENYKNRIAELERLVSELESSN